ncbi:MAG: sel1 repeat family protein [Succinivibrionaceae bacterium]|nr:sel1 repeat family protein [Succinivibrionaceae bacterium]
MQWWGRAARALAALLAAQLIAGAAQAAITAFHGPMADKAQAYHDCVQRKRARACTNYSLYYIRGEAQSMRGNSTSFEYAKRGCDMGDGLGCTQLGLHHEYGISTKIDPKAAFDLYFKSCKLKSSLGCYNLALEYVRGRVVPKDRARARQLFAESCENSEHGFSCHLVADIYESERFFSTTQAEIAHFYQRGCELGDHVSCLGLSVMTRNGEGVPQDALRARNLARRSCHLGNITACLDIAEYFRGLKGTEHNRKRTIEYYGQACSLGSNLGCSVYRELIDEDLIPKEDQAREEDGEAQEGK